jgi:hypothetical protein
MTGRLAAITMITNTNIGSVNCRPSRYSEEWPQP